MSEQYALAPEFASQPRLPIPANRLVLRAFDWLMRLQRRSFAFGDRTVVRTHLLQGPDGDALPVLEIAPKDLSGSGPALLAYHGGGFFFSHSAGHLRTAERYALEANCRVFFPDYRISIDHPFPAAFDDCYAALAWVHEEAEGLGVDPARVAVLGDSAGGALAAGVAQKALDLAQNPICAQVLIYPVTDHLTQSESARRFTDTPIWKTSSNLAMWKVYLRGHNLAGGAPAYAAPLHRQSFAGLPPAWVEVAEFDPLRDEGRQYAEALEAAGVPMALREAKGAVHGYDLAEGGPTSEAMFQERMAAIQRFFDDP